MATGSQDLIDAGVAELKMTTVGYINARWTTPPQGSHWGKALALLDRARSAPETVLRPDVQTLLDLAVAQLKLTTVGYRNKYWSAPPPSGTYWANGLSLLGQARAALETQPPPPPPPPAGTTLPSSIARDGSQDVSVALSSFVNNVADGTLVQFGAGTFRVDTMIDLGGLNGVTLDLTGATIKWNAAIGGTLAGGYSGNDELRAVKVSDSDAFTVRGGSIVGPAPMPPSGDGFKPWEAIQHMHGIALYRVTNFLVDGLDVTGSPGDGVSLGNENSGIRSSGILRNCFIHENHRCGVAVVGCDGVLIVANRFRNLGFWTIDLEPNTIGSSNYRITIDGNQFDPYTVLVRCAIGAFAGSKDGQGECTDLVVRNNRFDRTAEFRLNTNINGGYPYPKRIKRVRFENNVGTAGGTAEINQVDTLDIVGNNIANLTWSLRSCTDAYVSGSPYTTADGTVMR